MRAFLGALLSLAATSAFADDPMASLYANTVVITTAKGEMGRTLTNADHTFTSYQPDGRVLKGTWKIVNNQVCSTVTDPAIKPPPHVCRPLVARKIGDTWTMTQGGASWTATLKAGR
ncbi:MAG TPA: hypothetical protein VH000_04075 [Rhizomicrobium sp.]|jgi:hypothetical protein|nr:hypothetical protein [Rhizomicrobium sp.]